MSFPHWETTNEGAWSVAAIITEDKLRRSSLWHIGFQLPSDSLCYGRGIKSNFPSRGKGQAPTWPTPFQPHLKYTEPNTLCLRPSSLCGERHHGPNINFHMLILDFSSESQGVLIMCYLLYHILFVFRNYLLGLPANFSVGSMKLKKTKMKETQWESLKLLIYKTKKEKKNQLNF